MGTHGWQVAFAIAIAFAVAVFYGGVAVYVVGSYFFARAHHPARGFSLTLREAIREGMLAALVQPLLPLYYLVGRRMGGVAGRRPVVLVHGYGQNRVDFVWLARALGKAGLGPMYGFNYWPFSSVAVSAAGLARFVTRVCADENADAVDLVCHSMGGLLALELLGMDGARVRRLVTIGTPHAGVAWRGPILGASAAQLRHGADRVRDARALDHAALSIYSTHDNVVGTATTSSLIAVGGRDLVVPGLGHVAMLFDRRVAQEIAAFLAAE
ncbi:MAG: alpha/beta fold hydrolase [Deltaproteobacteria bacterium]